VTIGDPTLKKLDIIAALALLGLSALVAVATWDLPYWARFTPGPAFASLWVAGTGALIAAILLVQALRSSGDRPADWPDAGGGRQVLFGAAALWLLFLCLPWLGTALSSLLFMLLFLLAVVRRPVVPSIVTSVLTVAVVEAVFGLWLKIGLPEGVIGF
jgi:hypothetical protein